MRLSDAEWKVMSVVWDRGTASAREVLDVLEAETGWAYTTVKTVLARLAGKGALAVEMRGNKSEYQAKVTKEEARQSALRSLADAAFEGSLSPMLHFLANRESLSRRDRDELIALLEARPESDRKRARTDRKQAR